MLLHENSGVAGGPKPGFGGANSPDYQTFPRSI
jgi:hypothetical protein